MPERRRSIGPEEKLRLTAGSDGSIIEENHALRYAARVLRPVGDEDHGHLALFMNVLDEVQHVVAQRRAERRKRLVQEQDRAVAHQHAGQRDALALAAGKLTRQALLLAGKPGACECLGYRFAIPILQP